MCYTATVAAGVVIAIAEWGAAAAAAAAAAAIIADYIDGFVPWWPILAPAVAEVELELELELAEIEAAASIVLEVSRPANSTTFQ